MLAIDDLNLGEEVAFSINSVEQDKPNPAKKQFDVEPNGDKKMNIGSKKQQKYQQMLEKQ